MEINFNNETLEFKQKGEVTISRQQRNGRKSWTLVDNFAEYLNDNQEIKDFIKIVKKKQCCNGSVQDNKIIQFQGDCVDYIRDLLVNKYGYSNDEIVIKGI